MDAVFQDSRNAFAAEDVASYIDLLADSETIALIKAVLVQESGSYGMGQADDRTVFRRRTYVALSKAARCWSCRIIWKYETC